MKNTVYHSTFQAEKSIVVLPFVNMSADSENEYFSDGITEEIINALTRIDGLKVIARTSSFAFKGKNVDVREIGNQLGVSSVLEGSVRKIQNRVRITAQLINAEDGTHFWSKNFDRNLEDIFELQDEISLLIANQIRENFGHFNIQEHLVNEPTKNMQAYELYLKGHFYQLKWDAESTREAIKYYEASVAHDPGFARAYYGLVQCYGPLTAWGYLPAKEGFQKVIQNFMIASKLDSSLPEYGTSLIGKSFWMDWDFHTTYDQLSKTVVQHPKYTDGLEAMADLFMSQGYWPQAEQYIQKAMDIDPLSANHFYTFAHIKYYQKKFEPALELTEKALGINPDFMLASELKSLCLTWLNRKADFNHFIAGDKDAELKSHYFQVLNEGRNTLPEETLQSWRQIAAVKELMVPYELFIMANSGYKKDALELLNIYIAQKRAQLINFRQDPSLEVLRKMNEFSTLHISNFTLHEESGLESAKKAEPKLNTRELDIQMKKLMNFIEREKPYLDAQLSLGSLAESIQLHPNRLSFLINEKTGMNFNEFVNQFRLANFKEIAVDENNAHLSILGLAYESGFNSKTVFNAYFKKMENTTPGNWLKQAKQ